MHYLNHPELDTPCLFMIRRSVRTLNYPWTHPRKATTTKTPYCKRGVLRSRRSGDVSVQAKEGTGLRWPRTTDHE